MRWQRWVVWTGLFSLACTARAEDWPTYNHDNFRSAHTSEALDPIKLTRDWSYQSPQPPRQAWAGPAKWDAYAGIHNLRSMRNYDPVFYPIVIGDRVYFGSTTDDSVHCLDVESGAEQWVFTTDGAVRISPSYSDGRLYFGSDDGYAYCIDAEKGSLVWKFAPVEPARLILNNGRFLPFTPCRTGVLVADGIAYFGHGLLPWKPSYLSAIDAKTGKVAGAGTYTHTFTEALTLEGALLASSTRLFAPQGRIPPMLFDRKDGKKIGSLDGGGGCFVLLTSDDRVLHGPGNKTGWITDSSSKTQEKVASYPNGNAMIVAGDIAYMLTDTALGALDRKNKKPLWTMPCNYPYAMTLAGETLFVGGYDRVAAFSTKDGAELWRESVLGRAYGLVVANGMLLVSTDEGILEAFRVGGESSVKPTTAAAPTAKVPPPERKKGSKPVEVALGPYLKFTSPTTAVVRWRTHAPTPTAVEYWQRPVEEPVVPPNQKPAVSLKAFAAAASAKNRSEVAHEVTLRHVADLTPKTEHEVVLDGLRKDSLYLFVIQQPDGESQRRSQEYECDTSFNYTLPKIEESAAFGGGNAGLKLKAARALEASGVTSGLCLVLGSGTGELAYELAKQSTLRVVGVDTDRGRVEAARERLRKAGVYGDRVAIHPVDSLDRLPFTGACFNLVVLEEPIGKGGSPLDPNEITRLLRPNGGVFLVSRDDGVAIQELAKSFTSLPVDVSENDVVKVRRRPLTETGQWSHLYGSADNSAFDGETLGGAKSTDEMEVQWLGHPGPRAQPDRNGRKPSPLATNGRLFVQGQSRIIALDAYNGSVLWSLEISPLARFNMPRDCSNWCADDDYIYAAIGSECWRIDAATGEVRDFVPLPPTKEKLWSEDWGYLASTDDHLLGSKTKKGTAFINFFGGSGSGWYDAISGEATHKICSDEIFALDKQTSKPVWSYVGGLVLNSTISVADGRVYWVETRNSKVKASKSRRVGMPELWLDQFLVCLDLATGKMVWEEPIDTADGKVVFYMAVGSGKIVILSSDKQYHVYGFDQESGKRLWSYDFAWPNDDHGAHMSRPAIVGNRVFVRPAVLDAITGIPLATTMPGGGCGTYAATANTLLFRAGNVTMWDPQNGSQTSWSRLRPDCWLSTIPAGGMILSPEGGGGCSCGSWMETSVGFLPLKYQE